MTFKRAILAAAIATLFTGAAQASPYGYGYGYGPAGISVPGVAVGQMIQPARIVCDVYGRCWHTRPRYVPPVVYMPTPLPYYGYGYGYGHRRHYHGHHWRHW